MVAAGLLACVLARSGYAQSQPQKYVATMWQTEQGLPQNTINDIVQDHDGYIWIATQGGLARFDGVRFKLLGSQEVPSLRTRRILSLHASAAGDLWIASLQDGLIRLHNGAATVYTERDGLPNRGVNSIHEDVQGNLWINTLGGIAFLPNTADGAAAKLQVCPTYRGKPVSEFLMQARDGSLWFRSSMDVMRFGADGSISTARGGFMAHEARDGSVWVAFENQYRVVRYLNGMFADVELPRTKQPQWTGNRVDTFDALPNPKRGVLAMATDTDGELLMLTPLGLLRVVDGKLSAPEALPVPSDVRVLPNVRSLMVDREGNRWVGTVSTGLFRFRRARVTAYAKDEGLSDSTFRAVFQDRDGRVWLGGDRLYWFDGDQFHLFPRLADIRAISQTKDGDLWFGGAGGLYRWRSGEPTRFNIQALYVYEILPDRRGTLWIGAQIQREGTGLFWFHNGVFDPTGMDQSVIQEDSEGGLWAHGGSKLVYMRDGKTVVYDQKQGLPTRPLSLYEDSSGTFWITTANGGLCRLRNGRLKVITTKDGLPDNLLWGGLDDGRGHLWVTSYRGIFRLNLQELNDVADGKISSISSVSFGIAEGMKTLECEQGVPLAGWKARDGRLWFPTNRGVVEIDPAIPDPPPPPVVLEEARANQLAIGRQGWTSLAPGNNTFDFAFTALSLSAPEKQRFRYRLEPYDKAWVDAGTQRTAHYTNMAPGEYTFRVSAANSYGVWNLEGATVRFMLKPHFYQTSWFYGLCALAFSGLVWAAYQLRIRQLHRQFNMATEARIEERLRVARELHDTLLQSFQASLIQMQAARDLFSRRPAQAAQNLDDAITMAAGAITEGRGAIQELRSQPADQGDLEQLFTLTGQDLSLSQESKEPAVRFRVVVEGERQPLKPLVQDEIYRIARELLRNAFRHAHASQIEAEIRYEPRQLCVLVRDDGKGIDPQILKGGGRDGHWGLAGMRERAKRIGARLDFWSEIEAGTEVQLTIPASIAYQANHKERWSWLLGRKRASS